MFWSSSTCGICAASNSAWMAETSTASLVRTISRKSFLQELATPLAVRARRPLLQIGDQLGFTPAAGHGIEHKARDEREEGQEHEARGQDCSRNPRHDALLEKRHKNRNREHDRNGRQGDTDRREEYQRTLRSIEPHDRREDAQPIAPGVQLRDRTLRTRVLGAQDLRYRELALETLVRSAPIDRAPRSSRGCAAHRARCSASRPNLADARSRGSRPPLPGARARDARPICSDR